MTLRVTVTDVEEGETGATAVPEGDYLLVCHYPCRLSRTQVLSDGTVVLTISGRRPTGVAPDVTHQVGETP